MRPLTAPLPALGVLPRLLSPESRQVPENISSHTMITSQGLNLKPAGILTKIPTEEDPPTHIHTENQTVYLVPQNGVPIGTSQVAPRPHPHPLKRASLNLLTSCLS